MSTTDNGWRSFDTWAERGKTLVWIVLLLSGIAMAWANMNNRVCILDKRVTAIERLVETKLDPMRDDLITLKTDTKAVKEDIAEIKQELQRR